MSKSCQYIGEILVLEQKIDEKSGRGSDTRMAKGNLKKSLFFFKVFFYPILFLN